MIYKIIRIIIKWIFKDDIIQRVIDDEEIQKAINDNVDEEVLKQKIKNKMNDLLDARQKEGDL